MAEKEQRIRKTCPFCKGRCRKTGIGMVHPKEVSCGQCWDRGWILEYKPK